MFDDIHELCGPVMQMHVDQILENERNEIKQIKINCPSHNSHYAHVKRVIELLLKLDDDEFSALYQNISSDINLKNMYYICAFLSDTELIKKLSNSMESFNLLLNNFKDDINYHIQNWFVTITYENIKLLMSYGCDCIILFKLTYIARDYTSMKYIIDMMTKDQLDIISYNIITAGGLRYSGSGKYKGLVEILILDKFHDLGLNYMSIINDNFNDNMRIKTTALNNATLIVECYYIIK
jgi:hypothetical protein